MLQNHNGVIVEQGAFTVIQGNGECWVNGCDPSYQPIYWGSYPVYVCTDKTKKAIDVLQALQAEKWLKCDSVPRFIELVEKIAGLL